MTGFSDIAKIVLMTAIIAPFVLPWLYLTYAFAEPQDMKAGSLLSYLFIPAEIRALDLPGRCSMIKYSLSYQECGGICGTYYRIDYGTTATEKEVEAFIVAQNLPFLKENIKAWDFSKFRPEACMQAMITIYDDYSARGQQE